MDQAAEPVPTQNPDVGACDAVVDIRSRA
jgi:hypothetical protein